MSGARAFGVFSGRLLLATVYPIMECVVFININGSLGRSSHGAGLQAMFAVGCLLINYLALLKVTMYIAIYTIKDKSTVNLFPKYEKNDLEREFANVNPFIAESFGRRTPAHMNICPVCGTYKPPRSHHSAATNKCYLKYDHFSLILNTVIAFQNFKVYYQLIATTLVSSVLNSAILAVFISQIDPAKFASHDAHLCSALACALAELAVAAWLLARHSVQISRNETSVERRAIDADLRGDSSHPDVFVEGPIGGVPDIVSREVLNPYNLGLRKNWISVFGENMSDWITSEMTSDGDGIHFKQNAGQVQAR